MKVIIAGSRSITDYTTVVNYIENSQFDITEVVYGGSSGVDALGKLWADENDIPVKSFPAYWTLHGRAAGPIRNAEMANYADALIAIWDGESKGTKDMIEKAMKKGLYTAIWNLGAKDE